MNLPEQEENYAERRQRLAAQIASQRAEFSQAFAKLEQPIRYAEYGMRGVGFLRANPWIFAAAPAAVSVIKTLLSGASPKQSSRAEARASSPERGGFRATASNVVGHGWRLFQLYRRVRSYFP